MLILIEMSDASVQNNGVDLAKKISNYLGLWGRGEENICSLKF
jgi:hypothetical protein